MQPGLHYPPESCLPSGNPVGCKLALLRWWKEGEVLGKGVRQCSGLWVGFLKTADWPL